MTKTEAKQKLQAGEIQIHFDDKSKVKVLRYLTGKIHTGCYKYYNINDFRDSKFGLPIIKISEIIEDEEESVIKESELQWRYIGNEKWNNHRDSGVEYRLKPKTYFQKEDYKPNEIEVIGEEVLNTPDHYNNSKGTLYKVGLERNWNPYLFDIVKRLERAEKKGEFKTDLEKSINVIKLWLKETE